MIPSVFKAQDSGDNSSKHGDTTHKPEPPRRRPGKLSNPFASLIKQQEQQQQQQRRLPPPRHSAQPATQHSATPVAQLEPQSGPDLSTETDTDPSPQGPAETASATQESTAQASSVQSGTSTEGAKEDAAWKADVAVPETPARLASTRGSMHELAADGAVTGHDQGATGDKSSAREEAGKESHGEVSEEAKAEAREEEQAKENMAVQEGVVHERDTAAEAGMHASTPGGNDDDDAKETPIYENLSSCGKQHEEEAEQQQQQQQQQPTSGSSASSAVVEANGQAYAVCRTVVTRHAFQASVRSFDWRV